MNETNANCRQCRYFLVERERGDERALSGMCRRRSPGVDGWPGTRASAWCGDWLASDPAQPLSAIDLALVRLDQVREQLAELDERLTAMELSVTAVHLDFRGKDA